jgi:predicted enzyme related to lactoylglutathione lyase
VADTREVEDARNEHERLKKMGVAFSMEPTKAGPVTVAVFADTCGNRFQIHQA